MRSKQQMQTRRAVADPRWGRTSHVGHHMGEAPLTNRGVQPTCLFLTRQCMGEAPTTNRGVQPTCLFLTPQRVLLMHVAEIDVETAAVGASRTLGDFLSRASAH